MSADSTHETEQERARSRSRNLANVIRAFVRAHRASQMYLPNSPMRSKAREEARETFRVFWLEEDELSLTITEQQLRSDDREVYRDDERNGAALPWLLFRDGLRRIDLQPGFEERELDMLLDILQQAREATTDDDDLITRLWLADFQRLSYRNVELLQDFDDPSGGEGGAPSVRPVTGEPTAAQAIDAPALGDTPTSWHIPREDEAPTLHFLDPQETAVLQAAIRREYEADGLSAVLSSLFDILEVQEDAEVRLEVCDILDGLLLKAVAAEDYPVVVGILRDARAVLTRVQCANDTRRAISALAMRMNTVSAVDGLLSAIERGLFYAEPALLETLLGGLGYDPLVPLIVWFADAPPTLPREVIEAILTRQLRDQPALLLRLLNDPQEAVVRGALLFAREVASSAMVAQLSKLLRWGAEFAQHRSATLLAAIASPEAMDALQNEVGHELRDVRMVALRAITAARYRAAFPRLLQEISAKVLRRADLSEKRAFVEALAASGHDEATAPLDAILHQRHLLGHRESSELRMCAAYGLGLINTAQATRSLERAADTSDALVRRAVSQAMRGAL
jgi:HEAT repeat protein